MITFLLALSTAFASVDPDCLTVADAGPPADYSEETQNNYLLNFYSLATTFSPLHAPIPNEPGRGSLSIELSGMPQLKCEQRLVLSYTKTEDTNKTPVLPRPRGTFTFPAIELKNGKSVVPYAGFGYVPPVPIKGTRNVMVSFETGVGFADLKEGKMQYGLRYHATLMRTFGDIATPFVEGDPAYEDIYIGSTFGLDAMVGYKQGSFTHYLSAGWLDVSTFFYIDDDAVVSNNTVPYAGPAISLGTAWTPKTNMDLAGEFYTAPTTLVTSPEAGGTSEFGASATDGSIYTVRFKVGYLF